MISEPKAGELNKRIQIYDRYDVPDGEYHAYEEDTLICTCWAKIEPVGGAIYYGSINTTSAVTHRIWIRAIKGKTDSVSIKTNTVIKLKSRYYRAVRVTDLLNKFTVIECNELGAVEPVNALSEIVAESLE